MHRGQVFWWVDIATLGAMAGKEGVGIEPVGGLALC